MTITELEHYDQLQFVDLKQLMSELTDKVELMEQRADNECSHSLSRVATEEGGSQFTQMSLMSVLKDWNSHLYVVQDSLTPSPSPKGEGSRIIGCATLCVFQSPTGTKASIEDVVVSSAYRGQHLGKQLVEHVLKEAQRFAPIELHLTSNPKRVVANNLYQSLGFQRKETNCYQLEISRNE